MLIFSVIWTIALATCVVARSDNYGKKMEASRMVRHLQMNLEAAQSARKVGGDALTRGKRGFELHDWLSPAQKQEIRMDGCNMLNNLDTQQSKLRVMFRRDLFQNNGNAHLLSNEQAALLEDMKDSGANEEDVKRRVEQYYSAIPEYRRVGLDYQLKRKCIEWIREIASFDEIQLFLDSFQRRNRLVFNTLLDEYFDRLSKEQQDELHYIKDICSEMWSEVMNSNRQKRYVNKEYNEWILWMSDEQKRELQEMRNNGSSFDEIHKKVNGHFVQLPEAAQHELIEDYKEKCRKYFATMANEDEVEKLNTAHNEKNHNEHEKIIDEILHRQPQDVRDKAYKFYQICDDVYHKQPRRSKRAIDALMAKHLQWLTPEQKAEIKQMKANGESLLTIKQKLLSYIETMESDKQLHAIGKTKQSCYAWLENVTSAEERAELENLHHTDHSTCKRKIREYIKRLPSREQEAVNEDLEICEHIWYSDSNHGSEQRHDHNHQQRRAPRWPLPKTYAETTRIKRDHHDHSLEEYFQTHL
ncbi:unnamed protein product, partial [Litomosoides sigmodontis]